MMGLSLADMEKMSITEYEEILYHWNEAHRTGDDVDAPDAEMAMRVLEAANADPRLTH
jgi:hypothetical protein